MIHKKNSSPTEATWEFVSEIKRRFPTFSLDDKGFGEGRSCYKENVGKKAEIGMRAELDMRWKRVVVILEENSTESRKEAEKEKLAPKVVKAAVSCYSCSYSR